MDFLSLSNEYESYKEHIENSNNSMNCISQFFESFQKYLNDYATNTQKSLNLLFTNLIKFDSKSTHIKKFFGVCRLFEKHLLKLTSISKKIYTELVQPTNDFSKFIVNDNNIHLNELRKIINETSFEKKKYENIKRDYLIECRKAAEQEKNLLKEMDNNKSEYNIKNQYNILTLLRVNAQELCEKYKIEYKSINELYDLNNKKYFPIINNLRDNEEKRINFLSFNLEKFISYLNEEKNSLNNFLSNLKQDDTNKNFLKVKLEEDMKNYKDKFNYCKKQNVRFIKEDLLLYEIHRKNIDSIIKNQNSLIIKTPLNANDINNINNINNLNNSQFISYNRNVFNFETVSVQLNYDDQIIFNNLFDGDSAPPNFDNKKFSIFKKKLIDDIKFAEEITDKMLGEIFQKPIYYEFKNFEKFDDVKQILIDISMNKEVRENFMEMNYGIIFIAEKGFYYDKNENIKKYLSKEIVKEDNNFKSKYFWKNLLDKKINSTVETVLKQVIEKEKKKGSIIEGEKKMSKKKEILNKELMNVIKDYIVHFTNFNLGISDINDIIIDLKSEYSLNNEEMSYLISFLNSNTYNIRSKYHKEDQNTFFTKKIKNTKNKKYKQILLALNSCFMFLTPKDFINIKNINKTYYKQLEKLIYKQIFIKRNKNLLISKIDLSNNQNHYEMWFNFLKYDKKQYNYNEIIIKAKESKELVTTLEMINLDVMRTHFDIDQENKRNKIRNVLLSLAYIYPEISYCQGMNYISQFLLELTGSEEKSFDIFSAILNKTEYSKLILNEMELMKKYFYVFERLICIYLPELYTTFKRNNINANYFISPWFITLYTHSFNGNHTKILMFIFDLYILDGWLAIARIGLMLLKYYQNDLFTMEFEELLHFLINELKEKYDFFNNNNYDKFIELYKDMKLPKGLVNNIENEYELNKKIIKKK